jgi:hypothetical protein
MLDSFLYQRCQTNDHTDFCFARIGISEQHIRKDDNAYHQGCYVKACGKTWTARQGLALGVR